MSGSHRGAAALVFRFRELFYLIFRVATFSSFPDPLHWRSFYSLPRTLAAARQDGWGLAFASRPAPVRASTWCREDDYRLCLLFDAQGSVAGLQVSVAVRDYEESFDNIHYPIHLETEWKRQTLLDTEVYSATALFVSPSESESLPCRPRPT